MLTGLFNKSGTAYIDALLKAQKAEVLQSVNCFLLKTLKISGVSHAVLSCRQNVGVQRATSGGPLLKV